MLLNQMLSEFSMTIDTLGVLSSVPNIPFIKSQVMSFLAARSGLDITTKSIHDLDLLIDGTRCRQIIGSITVPFTNITMQTNKISIITDIFQYSSIPFHIGWKSNFG